MKLEPALHCSITKAHSHCSKHASCRKIKTLHFSPLALYCRAPQSKHCRGTWDPNATRFSTTIHVSAITRRNWNWYCDIWLSLLGWRHSKDTHLACWRNKTKRALSYSIFLFQWPCTFLPILFCLGRGHCFHVSLHQQINVSTKFIFKVKLNFKHKLS